MPTDDEQQIRREARLRQLRATSKQEQREFEDREFAFCVVADYIHGFTPGSMCEHWMERGPDEYRRQLSLMAQRVELIEAIPPAQLFELCANALWCPKSYIAQFPLGKRGFADAGRFIEAFPAFGRLIRQLVRDQLAAEVAVAQ